MVVLAAIVVWAVAGRGDDSPTSSTPTVESIAPVAVSIQRLRTISQSIGEPIYWAGPQAGYKYELSRTSNGNVYVRYLPPGVGAGVEDARFLVIATYPFPGAFEALRNVAEGREVVVPGRGIALPAEQYPQGVHVAFPDIDYQLEVYDPSPARALRIATSGKVRPVR